MVYNARSNRELYDLSNSTVMTFVKLCALIVFALAAVATASPHHKGHMPEGFRSAVKKCAEQHGIADSKKALHDPTAEYGCFYDCLRKETQTTLRNPDSPMAKDLVACEGTLTKSGDDCADAYELKKCMKQKFMDSHPDAKQE